MKTNFQQKLLLLFFVIFAAGGGVKGQLTTVSPSDSTCVRDIITINLMVAYLNPGIPTVKYGTHPLTILSFNPAFGTITAVVDSIPLIAGPDLVIQLPSTSGPFYLVNDTIPYKIKQKAVVQFNQHQYCQGPYISDPAIVANGPVNFYGSPPAFTTNFINASTGVIDLNVLFPGPQEFSWVQAGCNFNSGNVTHIINAPSSASLAYQDTVCQGAVTTFAPLFAPPAGIFRAYDALTTSIPATNLAIDSTTGEINVSGSQPETYSIVYYPPGQCITPDTQSVTILEQPNPFFEYANTVFCLNDTNPLPDSVTVAGGRFYGGVPGQSSFPAAVVHPITGRIDLQATIALNAPNQPQFYYLYHTVDNGCPEDSIISIEILDLNAEFALDSQLCINTSAGAQATQIDYPGYFVVTDPFGLQDTVWNNNPYFPNVEIFPFGASDTGTYQVEYFLDPNQVQCTNSFGTTVEVKGAVPPPFVLQEDTACQGQQLISIIGPIQNPMPTFSGDSGLDINSFGDIDPSNTPVGSYEVFMTFVTGTCTTTVTLDTMVIEAPGNAQVAYGSNTFCASSTTNPVPSVNQPGNGTFYSPTLNVDQNSGEIFLNLYTPTSSVENHDIVYLPHTDSCANPDTVTVQLRTFISAQLAYPDSILCKGASNFVVPQIATPSPGQFSVFQYANPTLPDNNLIINGSTGAIHVDSSMIGPYIIVYTPDGQCSSTDTVTISIQEFPDPFIRYTDTVFCANGGSPIPDSIANPGGYFLGGVPGVSFFPAAVVDSVTGAIDLQATSNPNDNFYYLHYTADNGCKEDSILKIEILDLRADFAINSPFCFNEQGWATATQISQPGYFIVVDPNGVQDTIFNNAPELPNVDLVQLDNAVPGFYQIGYILDTSQVLCADSFWTTIEVIGVTHPPFTLDTNTACQQVTSVIVNGPTQNPSPLFSGSGNLSIANNGTINPSATPPGTYAVYMTTFASCTATTVIDSFEVVDPANSQIEYGDNVFCTNDTVDPLLPSIVSPLNGTFSSPTLPIDSTTGEIFLNQYTPQFSLESHTIKYTPHLDSCSNEVQLVVQLRAATQAQFANPDSILCKGSSPSTSTLNAIPSPGQYSVFQYGNPTLPDSNLIINGSSGEIDINASLLGNYWVEYTPDNKCASPVTITISIDEPTDPFFEYADTIFCINDTFPLPDTIASPGGSFVGGVPGTLINLFPAAIVDPVYGTIDLPATSAQNASAYYVTYTAGNGCKTNHTVKIEVSDLNSEFVLDSQVCFNAQGWLEASQVSEPGFFVVIDPNGLRDTIFNTTSPTPSIVDVIQVDNAVPGTYQVGYFLDTSIVLCLDSFWTSVNVLGVAHPPATLDTNVVCKLLQATNINVLVPLGTQTSFSSNGPPGLITAAGAITPSLANSGTYAIYQTTSVGACTGTIFYDSLEILEPVNAYVEYGGNVLCKSDPVNPVPSFYQPLGGTFSSLTPNFVDSLTGEILLDQYGPSNYVENHVIIYTPHPDSCGSGTQINVEVRSFSLSFSYPVDSVCNSIDELPLDSSSFISNYAIQTSGFLFTPSGLNIGGNGTIDPSLSVPNTYSVMYRVDDDVCPETFTANNTITITESPSAYFSYDTLTVCYLEQNISPDSIATTGGHFSSTSPGLVIDSLTGMINLSTSSIGSPTIVYDLEPTGCPVTPLPIQLIIIDTTQSNYRYPADTFCQNGINILPITTSGAGGDYSVLTPDSLRIFSNGEIDLAGSDIGMHIIQRIAEDPCSLPFNDTIWILPGENDDFEYLDDEYCQTQGQAVVDITSTYGHQGIYSCVDPNLVINDSSGVIDLASTPPGVYEIEFEPLGGVFCPDIRIGEIEIFAYDSHTSFSYPSDTVCQGSGVYIPTIMGDTSGDFSASGLIWSNPDSGIIDLNLTSPNLNNNVYTINYSLGGVCDEVVTVSLFVHEYDDAFFEYPSDKFCQNGTNPQAIDSTIVIPGGTFSTDSIPPSGLDPSTGLIYLLQAPLGRHDITYQTNGFCPYSSTVSVTILPAPNPLGYNFEPDSIFCAGDAVTLETFSSSDVSLWIDSTQITSFRDSLYEVTYTTYEDGDSITMIQVADGTSCDDTTIVILTVNPIPEVTILEHTGNLSSGDPAFILMESSVDSTQFNYFSETHGPVEVMPPNGITPLYDALELAQLDLELSSLSGLRPGTATVYVVPEAKGCLGPMDSVIFQINPADVKIFIPEAFTPNGDGWNDTWKVQWTEDLSPDDYTLRVFNRSHGKVAQDIHPIHPNWTGDNLPDGVYWWVLLDRAGNSMRTGGVTIRRQ